MSALEAFCVIVLCVCGIGVACTVFYAFAYAHGADDRGSDILDEAIDDPIAFETRVMNHKLKRLEAERAEYGVNAFH